MRRFLPPLIGFVLAVASISARAQSPQALEFFESKIRPIFARECYECHSTKEKQRAGLNLDHRDSALKGSDSGPVIVPGKPEASLLLKAIRHDDPDLKMPKARARLSDAVIADFAKWIEMGAPDPRDAPPSDDELAAMASWDAVMAERKKWWSFLPITAPAVPSVAGLPSSHPVDRFLFEAQAKAGLEPSPAADKRALVRRATFVLTGLPPTRGEVDTFLADDSNDAFGKLVDRLIDSKRFGERWARHWMDWVRYAESHGSEGDPAIPYAWRYRDYLIRALNADVPYDQMVREHLAGDLLEKPRVVDGINQSALGTAHYRMVHHGFAPTDALDEQVRFTDNQIDVVSKAFLGITVSCARCHNHKFDAISQADFYSLYGIFTSCRPALINVETGENSKEARKVMVRLKDLIRKRLASAWIGKDVAARLLNPDGPWQSAIENAIEPDHPLHAWSELVSKKGGNFALGWQKLESAWRESADKLEKQHQFPHLRRWNVGTPDVAQWFTHGNGMPEPKPAGPGEFHLFHEGERVVSGIFPAGLQSHRLTTRDNAVFESPKIRVDENARMFARVAGDNQSLTRYVVQDYPRNGTVYPVSNISDGNWKWVNWKLDYWKGDHVHFEAATSADSPVLARQGNERSWIALQEVVIVREDDPAPEDHFAEVVTPLFAAAGSKAPKNAAELATLYKNAVGGCVEAWLNGSLDDTQARFLDVLARMNLLPNTLDDLPAVAPLVAEYRELEARLDAPVRSPGLVEAEPVAQPLFNRGNHRDPGEPVPRRFLDAFGARTYPDGTSGRRELAEDIGSDKTPLTARVIANRLWHHVFGRGIVATTDNFGRLGSHPSHPDLLDYLATRMIEDEWSIKKMIRLLVTSHAFQASSLPSERALTVDAENAMVSHYSVRRLEAEAIRDSLLSVSGQLEDKMFGPPSEGNAPRRSVYVRVIRNRLDPFLSVFDAPAPNSAHGVRAVSNVPAQALTMMNAEFVRRAAAEWAKRQSRAGRSSNVQIADMFETAFGRPPNEDEIIAANQFLRASWKRTSVAVARKKSVEGELTMVREELSAMIEPVRERLAAAKRGPATEGDDLGLKPMAAWDFSIGKKDLVGDLDLKLEGVAQLKDGALVLNGENALARSAPLKSDLRSKTLEVWVQLETLDQGGGGVITLQSQDGVVFDSIVYAERQNRRWMAGSDGFNRTKDFGGKKEGEAHQQPVHLAIVYAEKGMVTGYRNGEPYGDPYQSSGPATFLRGESEILFGLRHADSAPDKLLAAKVLRARVYDRALRPEEVLASSRNKVSHLVSAEDLEEALTKDQRARRAELEQSIAAAEAELEHLSSEDFADPLRPLSDLAHSIFNLKEFIYLR